MPSPRKPPRGTPRPPAAHPQRQERARQEGPRQDGPRREAPRPERPAREARQGARTRRGREWLYGRHAVEAALANPRRRVLRVLATEDALPRIRALAPEVPAEPVTRTDLDRRLPPGAVHQGIAAEAEPLPPAAIEDVVAALPARAAVLVLDRVSDPHNVGAVLRSAAAFGAAAVVTPVHGAPEATPALAKAASGALETVPLVQVVNLRRALDTLKQAGFWCLGLDGEAETTLGDADLGGRVALVLGAEGGGLRPLVREGCDLLLRIPIAPAVESLNVSNAAAVALYEWARRRPA